jgi:hypothetical protein
MLKSKVKIAGYNIAFEASAGGPELEFRGSFLKYSSDDSETDLLIKVHNGTPVPPGYAQKVFHAPFVEEIEGKLVEANPSFWSVWKDDSFLYILTDFHHSDDKSRGLLKFSFTGNEWDLWVDNKAGKTDPLEYPLDGLILYYLTVINKDIMIHASGVNFSGQGFLFTGISGKGKSTMARLWNDSGAMVVHDDRLILRRSGNGYRMFNTPVYDSDIPLDSVLDRIYIIEHGDDDRLLQIRESSAVSQVMANCIQHSWDPGIISGLLDSVSEMCRIIPTFKLQFIPHAGVIDKIMMKE